ncbi:anticodon-binding domain of tRNA family protein, partial [Vibrio parahaemolyticus VPTS-2010]
RTCSS